MFRIVQHISLASVELTVLSILASSSTSVAGSVLCILASLAAICPLWSDARQIANRIVEVQTVGD